MKKQYRLGVIGGGFMATAIVKGIVYSDFLRAKKIIVSDPSAQAREKLSELGVYTTANNRDVAGNCDYLLLAVKPQTFEEVAQSVKGLPVEKVITIMAGVKKEKIKKLRHELHAHPELSMKERETKRRLMEFLRENTKLFIEDRGHYFYAYANGKNEELEPIAFRADMDALKVQEETGLPFASKHPGMMHACGHDMHMAMVLAAAIMLKSREKELGGVVKILFQPSEERRPGGARLLLSELMKAPVPRAMFGQHVFPELPVGTIGIRPGAFFASSDNIIFSVEGKGTHAAMPHKGSDPILATAALIQFYQTLVTKFRDPLTPAVISITSVHGGTCNNVIPDKVEVLGTVRTHDNALRRRIFELIDEKSEAICSLYGCTFHRDKTWNGLPVLMNDPALTRLVQETATGLFGEENVRLMDHLTLGEDFAIYLEHIPGAFWVLGIRPPEQDTMPPLHNPRMSPYERALRVGISLLQETVLRSLAASSR